MSNVDLKGLDEPVRVEAAKLELTSFMARLQGELGLSDMLAVGVMECVLSEQRGHLCKALSQQVIACMNTLHDTVAKLDELQVPEGADEGKE